MVKGALGGAGVAALGAGAFGATHLLDHRLRRLPAHASHPTVPAFEFVSRPDLRPPAMTVINHRVSDPASARHGVGVSPGYLFLGPSASGSVQAGPMLADDHGQPAWFRPIPRVQWATDVRLATYKGQPAMTWWQGRMNVIGFGQGEGVIVDSAYREVARVRAGNGRSIDIHEFLVTPQGTALFTCFPNRVPADLSHIGGPSNGTVLEGIIQEVDIATGKLLFEWRTLEHVPVSDSYFPPNVAFGYDYMHLNSIDVAADGHLLVSARHTWALYKIHRTTGAVLWRLGGKSSDFRVDSDAQFSWQHDARYRPDGNISVFDDGAALFADNTGFRKTEPQSRGVVIDIDEGGKVVQLVQAYTHPGQPKLANAMGNFQTLPDGHALIGWGSDPLISEFTAGGALIADTKLGVNHDSYRAYRFPWRGTPNDTPAVAAKHDSRRGSRELYVSWNGATEVAHWLVSSGDRAHDVRPIGIAARHGFETVIHVPALAGRYAKVTALDEGGHHMGSSDVVRV